MLASSCIPGHGNCRAHFAAVHSAHEGGGIEVCTTASLGLRQLLEVFLGVSAAGLALDRDAVGLKREGKRDRGERGQPTTVRKE